MGCSSVSLCLISGLISHPDKLLLENTNAEVLGVEEANSFQPTHGLGVFFEVMEIFPG